MPKECNQINSRLVQNGCLGKGKNNIGNSSRGWHTSSYRNIGNIYTKTLKERELQGKFVELAVQILNSEPNPEAKNIRSWATKVINVYSPTITKAAQ